MTIFYMLKNIFYGAVLLILVTGCSKNEPAKNDVRTANEPQAKTINQTTDLKESQTETTNANTSKTNDPETTNANTSKTNDPETTNANTSKTNDPATTNANTLKTNDPATTYANTNTQTAPIIPKKDPGIHRVPFKDFSLQDFNGKTVSLKDFRGKVVVLNFWASWCPPCRAEMPELQSLHEAFEREKKAVLIGVNLADGYRETAKKAESFLKSEGLTFLNLVDDGQQLAQTLNIISIPTTYILDTQGRVVDTILGQTTKEKLQNIVSSLI